MEEFITPDDGHVDPSGITYGFAAAAENLGVSIFRRCRVNGIVPDSGSAWKISTEKGVLVSEHVVNAAGPLGTADRRME